MTRTWWILGCIGILAVPTASRAVGAEVERFAVADIASPSAPPPAIPSPLKSPGTELKSPGAAPLLPPPGLPTAPPPDQIKPIEPRAVPQAPKPDPVAADVGASPEFRYLAVLSGACNGFVVAGHAVPECAGKLVNVDFGNGRVAFLFSGREGGKNVITTFSGGDSAQPEKRLYHLSVDRMSTTTVDPGALPVTVVSPVEGDCTMRGDPTKEDTHFECRVRHDGKDTKAAFHSTGTPTVYAGDPRDADPDSRGAEKPRDYADGFTNLAARDPFPRVVTQ